MAKKKEPSLEEALTIFKAAMQRASLSNYLYVNKVLLSKNQKNKSILIIPEDGLWSKIIDDEEIKPNMKEINISDPEESKYVEIFSYTNALDDSSWVEVDAEGLLKGKVFKISIHGFEYEVPINRDLLPFKLKKSESNLISYRVITSPKVVLLIKKKFVYPLDGASFTLLRAYQVI